MTREDLYPGVTADRLNRDLGVLGLVARAGWRRSCLGGPAAVVTVDRRRIKRFRRPVPARFGYKAFRLMHRRSAGQVRNNYATGLSRRGIRLAFWNEWNLPSGGNVSHAIAIICLLVPSGMVKQNYGLQVIRYAHSVDSSVARHVWI